MIFYITLRVFMTVEPLAKVSKGTNFNEKREQTLYDGVI